MKLSAHFSLKEFTRSQTARRCGIDNTPGAEVIANLKTGCVTVLEPVRELLGVPLYVSSGFRCLALNRELGSKDTSQHVVGGAADLEPDDVDLLEAAKDIVASDIPFDQLILEFGEWLHISWSASPRRSVLTAHYSKRNGKTLYHPGLHDAADLEAAA